MQKKRGRESVYFHCNENIRLDNQIVEHLLKRYPTRELMNEYVGEGFEDDFSKQVRLCKN